MTSRAELWVATETGARLGPAQSEVVSSAVNGTSRNFKVPGEGAFKIKDLLSYAKWPFKHGMVSVCAIATIVCKDHNR